MTENELAIRQRLKDDFVHYAAKCLFIRTKEGKIQPFLLNKAQMYVHEIAEDQKRRLGYVRILLLKGRQQGLSTYVGGRYYHNASHHKGTRAYILTHEEKATKNLFGMAKRYHDNCPALVKPQTKASNAQELVFGLLESSYGLGTAKNKSVGRSETIQLFHGSEVAFWDNAPEHAKGILQAVPDQPGTEVFLESTANGQGNYFHQQWQKAEAGQSDYIPVFLPWFWDAGYVREVTPDVTFTGEENELARIYGLTPEQMMWRRKKIEALSVNGIDGEKAFKQEYPCTASEAFQMSGENGYISPEIVMAARKCEAPEHGALVIGVDPARFGDDRTSIIRRRTRKCFGLESHSKKNTMQVVGIVHKIIKEEDPAKVFVDVGGLGAGVVDRLIELGYEDIIVPVNSGETPLDEDKYRNKRAEMWGEMKLAMQAQPFQIPDSDSLQADLCNPRYSYDSNSRLLLEKKEDMKKRGLRSPDEADALALTFAYPAVATPSRAPVNSRRTGSFMTM